MFLIQSENNRKKVIWFYSTFNYSLGNCPTRWSLLLLIGYLCRSSQPRWQRNIAQQCANYSQSSYLYSFVFIFVLKKFITIVIIFVLIVIIHLSFSVASLSPPQHLQPQVGWIWFRPKISIFLFHPLRDIFICILVNNHYVYIHICRYIFMKMYSVAQHVRSHYSCINQTVSWYNCLFSWNFIVTCNTIHFECFDMLVTWELTPTAVTRTLPLPSITWVPDRTIGSTETPLFTCESKGGRSSANGSSRFLKLTCER